MKSTFIFNHTFDLCTPIFEYIILAEELDDLNIDFETAFIVPVVNWWNDRHKKGRKNMKNKEKYLNTVLNIMTKSGVPSAVDILSGKVVPCEDNSCMDCLFCQDKKYASKSCANGRVAWLNEEEDRLAQFRSLNVDTPIFVRDSEEDPWKPRYFSKVKDNRIYVFGQGTTSFTAEDCFDETNLTVPYKFEKLMEEKND